MDAVAVARPYAAAAFRTACDNDAVEAWQAALNTMAQAVDAVAETVAGGVLVSDMQAADIVAEVLASAGGGEEVHGRFLALLAENDRVFALPAIAARFDALRMEHANIAAVRVESAMPIDDKKGFDAYLEKRLGKKVQTVYEENSTLLGGVRVYVDDDVIDSSIRGRLDRLAASLKSQQIA